MNNSTQTLKLLAGSYEVSIGQLVVPAQLLGDITVTYSEGQIEVATQAGTRRQGSGKVEEANVAFDVYLPSMDYLGVLFPDNYTAKSGTGDGGKTAFGGGACAEATVVPVNLHPICEKTDKNDILIPAGIVRKNATMTLATGDAASVPITIDAQPNDDGVIIFGSPDPTQLTKWDATQQKTVAVSEDGGE